MQESFELIENLKFRPVVVLASGDPFHYGIGRQLAKRISPDEFLCIPQPSAFSLAAARLGWSQQETSLVTLHGRAIEGLIRHLHHGARILALSWDETTPKKVAELLSQRGFAQSKLTVLQNLDGPREGISSATADTFNLTDIGALNTIAIDVIAESRAHIIGFAPGLPDDYYDHDGKITKQDLRAITISALSPRNGELLWDVGLGAGSVAIEWLLCHPSLRAIGFECDPVRAARARKNATALGTPDLKIIESAAPQAFADQEHPDAIFIGGGLATDGMFDAAWAALKSGGRLVANAVTLESEKTLIELHKACGGELVRIEIAKAETVGRFRGWRPAMPILQWRVEKS